ncbi:MAG TPA: ABC transporter ATP-binding protein [Vicinamibacterales bacterium]|nr:ABC transporter ATP-binding protein [Vicinamibacterales bacterium]
MLRIENVSKTYPGGVRALRDVSLEIPAGMFGLLGPNGAGKTTLMRAVATLAAPDTGRILFGDLDVWRDQAQVRRRLGYLPQEFGVYPRVTAADMLDHLAVLKGFTAKSERREMVERLLHVTNLWEVRHRRLGTFSGGMRQRFGIAQALIGDPRLVIVDEPTAGLDPEERGRFLTLLSEIGEDVVVVLSTHIVDDVSDVCTGMAILVDGAVRCQGAPRVVRETLAGSVWRKAVTRSELAAYSGELAVLGARWHEGKLVVHVLSTDPPASGFERVPPDLQDLYFHTLRRHGAPAAGV